MKCVVQSRMTISIIVLMDWLLFSFTVPLPDLLRLFFSLDILQIGIILSNSSNSRYEIICPCLNTTAKIEYYYLSWNTTASGRCCHRLSKHRVRSDELCSFEIVIYCHKITVKRGHALHVHIRKPKFIHPVDSKL